MANGFVPPRPPRELQKKPESKEEGVVENVTQNSGANSFSQQNTIKPDEVSQKVPENHENVQQNSQANSQNLQTAEQIRPNMPKMPSPPPRPNVNLQRPQPESQKESQPQTSSMHAQTPSMPPRPPVTPNIATEQPQVEEKKLEEKAVDVQQNFSKEFDFGQKKTDVASETPRNAESVPIVQSTESENAKNQDVENINKTNVDESFSMRQETLKPDVQKNAIEEIQPVQPVQQEKNDDVAIKLKKPERPKKQQSNVWNWVGMGVSVVVFASCVVLLFL